ncbi:MAG: PQQ-like beta-propeller repeat protein [Myxococcales bacterium]|nr:PQQ-like beta-propeller repeat protein [Myxococcales bacterium]
MATTKPRPKAPKAKRAPASSGGMPRFPSILRRFAATLDIDAPIEIHDRWHTEEPRHWGLPPQVAALFPVLAQTKDGSLLARWQLEGVRPAAQPIVMLGSEGERGVIAGSLAALLHAIARGWTPWDLLRLATKPSGRRNSEAIARLEAEGIPFSRGIAKAVERAQLAHPELHGLLDQQAEREPAPRRTKKSKAKSTAKSATKAARPGRGSAATTTSTRTVAQLAAWRFRVSAISTPTSPTITPALLVTVIDDRLVALRRADGKQAWSRTLADNAWYSPTLADDELLLGDSTGTVHAVELATGALRWQATLGGMINGAPAVGSQMVVVGSGDGEVHGLDRRTGKERWRFRSERAGDEGEFDGTIVRFGALGLNTSQTGELLAWELDTGRVAWRQSYAPLRPIASDTRVHAIAGAAMVQWLEGKRWGVHRVDPTDGRAQWSAPVSDPIVGVLGDEALTLVVTLEGLHAFATADGTPRWTLREKDTWGAARLDSESLLVITRHQLLRVDPATGTVRQRSAPQTTVYLDSIHVAEGESFVTTFDGVLRLDPSRL